jgi:hypothetical protein
MLRESASLGSSLESSVREDILSSKRNVSRCRATLTFGTTVNDVNGGRPPTTSTRTSPFPPPSRSIRVRLWGFGGVTSPHATTTPMKTPLHDFPIHQYQRLRMPLQHGKASQARVKLDSHRAEVVSPVSDLDFHSSHVDGSRLRSNAHSSDGRPLAHNICFRYIAVVKHLSESRWGAGSAAGREDA